MSSVVQATCPGCRQVLRIPARWLGKPIRCKHCGTVLHAKPPAPLSAPPKGILEAPKPQALPPAKALQAGSRAFPRSQGVDSRQDSSPFANLDVEEPQTNGSHRRRGGWWKAAFLALGVLLLAGGLLAASWPRLLALMKTPEVARLIEEIKPGPKESAREPEPVLEAVRAEGRGTARQDVGDAPAPVVRGGGQGFKGRRNRCSRHSRPPCPREGRPPRPASRGREAGGGGADGLCTTRVGLAAFAVRSSRAKCLAVFTASVPSASELIRRTMSSWAMLPV